MRTYDKYEEKCINDNILTIQTYAICKTVTPVPNQFKLIKVGKREKLSIRYQRCSDDYFLEISLADCKAIMIAYEYDNLDETLDKL